MPKDLFSGHAKEYATFRPVYPKALYDFIFKQVKHFDCAWDCGTGNGQVARVLATRFHQVHATDISKRQLENAWPEKNIQYHHCSAEEINFGYQTFDLITVGQAIHWFDLDKFYREVHRVSKAGCLLAAFGYSPVRFTPAFNELLDHFYYHVIYKYWDTERKIAEDKYRSLEFPFDEIVAPEFEIRLMWSLEDLRGYITTWSSVQKYIQQNGHSPVEEFMEKAKPLWRAERESVYFPLFLRIGHITDK